MSLRVRLLFLSLITLLLPWAGCKYARQMEEVLRNGQEKSLLTTAQLLAQAVASDQELAIEQLPIANESAQQRLFAPQLTGYPLLDGLANEWPQPPPIATSFDGANLRLGIFAGALYVFLHANDAHVSYEIPDNDSRTSRNSDRVLIVTRDESGVEQAWSVTAVAPGPIIARRAHPTAPWKPTESEDDELRGTWLATSDGFNVELRIPQRLIGNAFAVAHIDDSTPPDNIELHPLRTASDALREKLAQYATEGVRIYVVDQDGWLLARAGALSRSLDFDTDSTDFYRWFLARSEEPAPVYDLPYGLWGPPVDAARAGQNAANWFQSAGGEPSTVRAAAPIRHDDAVVGAIVVEQAGSQLMRERDAAFANLLQFTVLATAGAVIAAFLFAAWLSRRIRRLSVAATVALSPQGDLDARLPEMNARDELGDLARSYATLLQRVKEYTQYLQTLGSKLSHEFRTPLAIISSSLENLVAENRAEDGAYVRRAREGAARLHGILTAMTEATRIEQSVESAERSEFDLADLVRGVGQAYAQTFASHRIEIATSKGPCPFRGAPELIVQMLDKLIDNAVDFCPPGGSIRIELALAPKEYLLSVTNEGPLLAPDIEQRAFDMLVSNRTGEGAKPHLGLGLFIVQTIARFHGGEARARNLPNLTGVTFEIRMPRA